jgi:DNA (cytosine-5)-methyltransferase 1
MTLTVGSLFSGIGGLDLGLERAGMRVIWQSEIDPFACKVLKKHWPKVPNLGDIKEIDWNNCERPDVICGGYPCQPFSTAGKRQGADDPRHLWPWVREAISELRPRYAIMENVRGHLSMGGLAVIGELASIGYDAEWRVISAASVGANHKRERIVIVAYPNDSKLGDNNDRGVHPGTNGQRRKVFFTDSASRSDSGTDSNWLSEPGMGRVADGVPNRVDRLRGLGNAVVPQVAEVVGRLVMEASWSR